MLKAGTNNEKLKILKVDIKDLSSEVDSVDAIITEPFLGPPLRGNEREDTMYKRTLTILITIVLFAGLASGIATSATTYTVASDTTWPPFEWADSEGNLLGFDLDVMRCIAVLQGFEIEIVSYDWDIIFDDVGVGRVDIGASGATITDSR